MTSFAVNTTNVPFLPLLADEVAVLSTHGVLFTVTDYALTQHRLTGTRMRRSVDIAIIRPLRSAAAAGTHTERRGCSRT